MSVRLSKDGCQNWSKPWTIWQMASGYSDLTLISTPVMEQERQEEQEQNEEQEQKGSTHPSVESDQLKFGILFESGLFFFWETLVFKMFDAEEVMRRTDGHEANLSKSQTP